MDEPYVHLPAGLTLTLIALLSACQHMRAQALAVLEHLQEFAKTTCYPSFFGKTRKFILQQFGKWLDIFWQLAIQRLRTRKFARSVSLAIA
jgi:hypothetical protein